MTIYFSSCAKEKSWANSIQLDTIDSVWQAQRVIWMMFRIFCETIQAEKSSKLEYMIPG